MNDQLDIDQTMVLEEYDSDAINGSKFRTILEESSSITDEHFHIEPGKLDKLNSLVKSYELGKKFAEGAQGEILTGTDKILKRFVAVKSLKKDHLKNQHIVNSFISEAVVTAQLDHPSIIPLYGINRDDEGGLYISMKLVHGQTLTELINKDRLNCGDKKREKAALTKRLEHFIHVCDAMAYAHDKKIIHRDLKPQNIMVGNFHEVYVMDWGIARAYDEKQEDRKGDSIAGTPGYIAPEALGVKAPKPSNDIYALGIILYELVCLKSALENTDLQTRLNNTRAGILPAMQHFRKKVKIHPDLNAVFQKACALDPKERYTHATQLADDIRQFIKKEEVSARPDNFIRKASRKIAANHHQVAAMTLMTLLIFAVITIESLKKKNEAVEYSKNREIKLLNLRSSVEQTSRAINRHFLNRETGINKKSVARITKLIDTSNTSKALLGSYIIDKELKIHFALNDKKQTDILHISQLPEFLEKSRTGQFETTYQQKKVIIDFAPIPALESYYVEIVDVNTYLKQ